MRVPATRPPVHDPGSPRRPRQLFGLGASTGAGTTSLSCGRARPRLVRSVPALRVPSDVPRASAHTRRSTTRAAPFDSAAARRPEATDRPRVAVNQDVEPVRRAWIVCGDAHVGRCRSQCHLPTIRDQPLCYSRVASEQIVSSHRGQLVPDGRSSDRSLCRLLAASRRAQRSPGRGLSSCQSRSIGSPDPLCPT